MFIRAYDCFRQLGVAVPTGPALAGIAACDERLAGIGSARDGNQHLLRHAESSGELGLTATALEGPARAACPTATTRVLPNCSPGPLRSATPTTGRPHPATRPSMQRLPRPRTERWPNSRPDMGKRATNRQPVRASDE